MCCAARCRSIRLPNHLPLHFPKLSLASSPPHACAAPHCFRVLLQLFRSFDRRPIAAASLGQVHRAVLLTGEEVVVKVQRPGLKQLFDIDLNNLRILAERLDKGDENRDFKVGTWIGIEP